MELRPYQQEAREAVQKEWAEGRKRTLLVLPTGTGKTVVFSKIIEDQVREGKRVLVLAHRSELLDQASDKLKTATGLGTALEKAESTSIGSWYRVVVGSVQTMQREKRLSQFPPDWFDTIVVDEAHHAISDGYQKVLGYFKDAEVLGVTATPDRGDMKNLGSYFDSLAYEYSLVQAIKEGYLSKIKALTIPIDLDLSSVSMSAGDFKASDVGTALDPYLVQIADEMAKYCKDRKTVVFLPLVKTSQKFRDILNERGFKAAEVNGESKDRAEVLEDFERGRYNVLCNSMLLTEGWDCPSVDCVVVLRPTKVRALYCLDEETEILTQQGWKKDVEVGENIAAFDIKTGEILYTPALAKVRRPLNEDEFFCSIKTPSIDIRVTNKHRMVYDNKRKGGWKIKTAEELAEMTSGSYIPVSGQGKFRGVPLNDSELSFIGWVMSDGTINPKNGQITITQGEHQPWLEEIQKTIDGCNFKYNRFKRKRDTQYNSNSDAIVWTISKGKPRATHKNRRGWGDIEPYLSKDLSEKLSDMTEHQFDILVKALHLGDGSKQTGQDWTRRSYHISTGNKVFAERLQIMAIARGYRANIARHNYNANPIYVIHLKKIDRINIGQSYDDRPKWIKEKHTDEMCWCVETKQGTLVTRRKGKVSILGNCQMVGRGTRLFPGKEELLLLDFLWHTERHELCRPAHLICESPEVAKKMVENMEEETGVVLDLEAMEAKSAEDVVAEREEALAKQLAEMRKRKRKLVDPLQFEMSIHAEDLSSYVPNFGWEMAPPSEKQLKALEKYGIFTDEVGNAGKANLLLDRLNKRRNEGLSTPKQIRFLESRGFRNVGMWNFESARNMIDRIAANGWRIPPGIRASEYVPN